MPYTVPTVQNFKDRFPDIVATDPQIQAALDEGAARVDTTWIEADYQPAILYYAAHVLTTNAGQVTGSAAGIASESFGPISVSYVQGSSVFLGTRYGTQFLYLLRINKAGPRVIST